MAKSLNERIIQYIAEMPSLPITIGKVLEVCNNPYVNPVELNQIISLDPVLTGKLLKLANSVYYGLNTKVSSIIKAITMLGLNTVKNLALSTAVLGTLPKNKLIKGINMEDFWHHSLCVGVTSKLMAARQGVEKKYIEEHFTAGLLHDIGKIPINACLPSEYKEIIEISERDQKPMYMVENEKLNLNHNITGKIITDAWKLDSSITDTIFFHHDIGSYEGKHLNILCNVIAADYFSVINGIGFAGTRNVVRPPDIVWNTLGFDDQVFNEIFDKVKIEIKKAKVFLQLS